VLYELGVMMILIPFLRARGWSRERLGIHPTVGDSMWGLGLIVVYYGVVMVLVALVANVWPQAVLVASRMRLAQGPFDWPTMITASVVNPVFEEVFVCGYVITALKERFGTTTAINVSAAVPGYFRQRVANVEIDGRPVLSTIALLKVSTIAWAYSNGYGEFQRSG
jgi:membrane protease YdiL (CAAX protease family)